MPTTPRRYPRKRNKDGSYSSIDLTSFTTVTRSSIDRGPIDQICDSAFLAERGLFTCTKSPKRSDPPAYNRRGEAA